LIVAAATNSEVIGDLQDPNGATVTPQQIAFGDIELNLSTFSLSDKSLESANTAYHAPSWEQ
jgi:hypothetical protein